MFMWFETQSVTPNRRLTFPTCSDTFSNAECVNLKKSPLLFDGVANLLHVNAEEISLSGTHFYILIFLNVP